MRDRRTQQSTTRRVRRFLYWRSLGARNRARELRETLWGARHRYRFAPVEPGVRYPCYKSLDAFVDTDRLRALDDHLRAGIDRCVRRGLCKSFDTGSLKRRLSSRRRPGGRSIELTHSGRPFRYHDLADTSLWQPAPAQEEFPELMEFIAGLPFQETARIVILCDEEGRRVPEHRDHAATEVLHEFIWFRTNLDKPFYVMDRECRTKRYVRSYTAWFDTVNQFHGADPADRMVISLRVDGRFTDEFRARIPRPRHNAASTPALWASADSTQLP